MNLGQNILIAVTAMAIAHNCHAANKPVYRCEKAGQVTYTDAPCEGAKEVDVTPTEGLNKWSGTERVSNEIRQQQGARQAENGRRFNPAKEESATLQKPSGYTSPRTQPPAAAQAATPPRNPLVDITNNLVSIAVVLFAGVLAVALALALKQKPRRERPVARQPLTFREQAMFNRLKETFPELNVLAQVAFSALLDARSRAVRNTFDRKVADFVLASKAFEVLAVIELDDASHIGRLSQDMARDAMLAAVGYRTLRFNHVPDAEDLRAAVAQMANHAKAF